MVNFAGVEDKYCGYDFAKVLLQSIPYDGTSTWGKGADKGYQEFMDALENMELYDIETQSEAYKEGVHVLEPLTGFSSPEDMFSRTYANTKQLLKSGKMPTFFGGEHSISIGIIKAFYEHFEDLTVLQIDAHTDLRPDYLGTPYNHACAVYDASQHCNLVQVGIRSMDIGEVPYLNEDKCFFAQDIHGHQNWMQQAIDCCTDNVYVTFDLDAFDPSIMPTTGTPEPGGLDWYTTINFLRQVFKQKNVVGFDIVELAPIEGYHAGPFLAAKLYYKMLTYKYCI